MSSQFLAIFYLSDLDHFIKENLRCKYYVRYMDDFIILDTNKEKLNKYYNLIVKEVEKIKLKVNKKSNIYRCSRGFSFLGYTYKVINNKLHISCKKATRLRIDKKLSYLKENDNLKYRKSLGSYYGYFDACKKEVREKIKVSAREVYNSLKKENGTSLVIIKDKRLYKIYGSDDAIIMWYFFNFSSKNGIVMFTNKDFDRVINKLNVMKINYLTSSKNEVLLSVEREDNRYLDYVDEAHNKYLLINREKKLISQMKKLIYKNENVIEEIEKIFNELEKM